MLEALAAVPPAVWTGVSIASLAGLGFAALGLPWLVSTLPTGWFVARPKPFCVRLQHAPAATLFRNVLGVLLLLAGVVMLFLPGQGLLTILVGLLFADLPGRDKLIRRLVRRPRVAGALQRIRAWRGVPPFEGLSSDA